MLLITGVALLCVLALAVASLRHTGSIAFPIDDGYIYSNYVAAGAEGYFFSYNPGETSGGITGLGWYLLCLVAYALLAPLHALFGGLAPTLIAGDAPLAAQAGHLYLAAYLPGATCLVATGLGTRKLAGLALPAVEDKSLGRDVLCWLLGVVAAADLGLTWGAMSGLEVALSSAVVAWALCLLLLDWRRGRPGWSLVLGAALPWARPDLLAFAGVGLGWLVLRFLLARGGQQRRQAGVFAASYLLACAAGAALLSLTYYLGWGHPLPSSFYAKVGGLRLFRGFGSAAEELLIAGRYLPFVVGGLALLGGLLWSAGPMRRARGETRWAALLLLLSFTGYVGALLLTQPWFGQEDRYLLPVHPCAIVLLGMLLWSPLRVLPVERLLARRYVLPGLAGAVVLVAVLANYLWATRNYVVHVRNITDAHIEPALWLSQNTPPEALVASEPIGAVRFFSQRRTFDIVGLTTPAALGTYRVWPETEALLRGVDARYLLFYPAWFDDGEPPAWAVERARFPVPDNRIAGDDLIAVYELRWDPAAAP